MTVLLVIFSSLSLAQPPYASFEECERYALATEKSILPVEAPYIIRITTQDEFAKLNEKVRKAIRNGKKNIEVDIMPGTYYYGTRPVYLYNIDAPDVCISINGVAATMTAAGKDYASPSQVAEVNPDNMYLDRNGKAIDLFGEVLKTESQVEVLDAGKKVCRLRLAENTAFHPGMRIQISQWYQTGFYPVQRIEDGYAYFVAEDLEYNAARKCYNVNLDYGVSKMFPRYRIWDPAKITATKTAVHECTVYSFLVLYQVKLRSFSISGISFNGTAKGSKNALLYFREVEAQQVCVKNCTFENLNFRAIQLKETDNFVFKDNRMRECMYAGVYSYMDCGNSIVTGNTFYRMGKAWDNISTVTCFGKNFLVSDNKFEDCGYCAINVGAHKNWVKEPLTSGVIEHNEVWYGDEYFNNGYKFNLVDGGAVYIATMNEKVIVRYNYIHNISGPGSNRGIYCDEGAMNVKIYGNVIRDIPNGHAVFSWLAKDVNKTVPGSNDGIDFFYNVIWGRYKFDERSGSTCIQGRNLVLYDNAMPENVLANFAYQEDESYFTGGSVRRGKVKLVRKAKKELKTFPTYKNLKPWIR